MARLLSGTLPPRRSVAPRRERGSDCLGGPGKPRRNRNVIISAGRAHDPSLLVGARQQASDADIAGRAFPITDLNWANWAKQATATRTHPPKQFQAHVHMAEGTRKRCLHPLVEAGVGRFGTHSVHSTSAQAQQMPPKWLPDLARASPFSTSTWTVCATSKTSCPPMSSNCSAIGTQLESNSSGPTW